jgi:hypothetical protein
VSVQTVESLDTNETWKDLCRELESIGLTTAAIQDNQVYIKSWFQDAMDRGLFEEQSPSADMFVNPFQSTSTLTMVDSASSVSQARKQSDGAVSMSTRKSSVTSLAAGSAKRKGRLSSVLFKMFRSDMLLLEAASDGDVKRVSDLINKGANVNAKDRWGWTPMSMAAYGGHEEIARTLMAAGADLDYKDVDGDTPKDLATKRGKRDTCNVWVKLTFAQVTPALC